jgi:hypothetical protein
MFTATRVSDCLYYVHIAHYIHRTRIYILYSNNDDGDDDDVDDDDNNNITS